MQDTKSVVTGLRAEGFQVNRGCIVWAIRDSRIPAPETKIGGATAAIKSCPTTALLFQAGN